MSANMYLFEPDIEVGFVFYTDNNQRRLNGRNGGK